MSNMDPLLLQYLSGPGSRHLCLMCGKKKALSVRRGHKVAVVAHCFSCGWRYPTKADIGDTDYAIPDERNEAAAEYRRERRAAQSDAAEEATKVWNRSRPAPADHPYLVAKGIQPHTARFQRSKGALLIAVLDIGTDEIISLQRLWRGKKRFQKGGTTKGGYYCLGGLASDKPIVVCEGFATAASIHESTRYPTVVSFTCGNLLAVAEGMRARYPERQIILAADNDNDRDDNPGVQYATAAARAIDARLVVPPADRGEKVDLNDVHQRHGQRAVLKLVQGAVAPPAESGDEIIDRLVQLYDDKFAYHPALKDAVKQTGVPKADLQKLVAERREVEEIKERGFLEPVIPWEAPVDLTELLDRTCAVLRRHVILPKGAVEAVALWTGHAHALDASPINPLLVLHSHTKRCGKTVLLETVSTLVPVPFLATDFTPAVIFRVIDAHHPTVLMDEGDAFIKNREGLRGNINAAHRRRGAMVPRCVGDDHKVTAFSVWTAYAIALIGRLHPTTDDRAIKIPMIRKATGDEVEPLPLESEEYENLRRKWARWAEDATDELRQVRPERPPGLHDRAFDNWRPLLAIAEMAGGEWPKLARRAARRLEKDVESEDPNEMLLEDIRKLFDAEHTDRFHSDELVTGLIEMENRPWAEMPPKDSPLTKNKLAAMLRGFGITTKQLRRGAGNRRGYERRQFEDVFARYVSSDPPSQSATVLQGRLSKGYSGKRNATRKRGKTANATRKAPDTKACNTVALWEGGSGEKIGDEEYRSIRRALKTERRRRARS